jgi:teichoic acid transport system permease protein
MSVAALRRSGRPEFPPAGPQLVRIEPPRNGVEYLRRLWSYRDFVLHSPLAKVRSQNERTYLGLVWNLLNPVFMAATYYVIIGVILGARASVPNYLGYLLIGIFVFTFTARSLQGGARAMTSSVALMSQIAFPRAALPVSAVLVELITHASSLAVLVVVVVATAEPVSWMWLGLLPLTALQATFNLGLALLVARLAFQIRDLQNVLPFLLRIWLYASGIFYTLDLVADGLGRGPLLLLFEVNPGYVFPHIARGLLLESQVADALDWTIAGAWSLGLLLAGFTYFRRHELAYGMS